jgi:hypothetical protein
MFIFFCSGINVHSNSETHRYYLEHSSCSNNFENNISHYIDISEEDQMDQSQMLLLPEQPECQKSGLCAFPLLNNLLVSVWQPPKVFQK